MWLRKRYFHTLQWQSEVQPCILHLSQDEGLKQYLWIEKEIAQICRMQLKFCYQEENFMCPWYNAILRLACKGHYNLSQTKRAGRPSSSRLLFSPERSNCNTLPQPDVKIMFLKTSSDSDSRASLPFLKCRFKAVFLLSLANREVIIYLAQQ